MVPGLTHWGRDIMDTISDIYTLSYYHHQIRSMNYYPLFRVRSWINGVPCMSSYILILMRFSSAFSYENIWIALNIQLKFIPKGPINNIPALVQIVPWHRPCDKPLSEPMWLVCRHITLPQWVNGSTRRDRSCCNAGHLPKICLKLKSHANLFAHNFFFHKPIIFVQSTADSLPCSVQYFKMIWHLKGILWTNRISQDFSLRWWASEVFPLMPQPPDYQYVKGVKYPSCRQLLVPSHGWVTVTTNPSYHQPRWRRPKMASPNNRGYQENLTVRCAHMTLTCRCHITLCISAMTMCFSSAGSENLHLEIFRKLVVTVRPCWS